MRIVLMAAALAVLAGCGLSPEWNAAQQQRIANYQSLEAAKAQQQTHYDASPEGKADTNCRTKVQFAMAGYQDRTFLGLEGMARGNQLHAQCLEYWRRTGQMP